MYISEFLIHQKRLLLRFHQSIYTLTKRVKKKINRRLLQVNRHKQWADLMHKNDFGIMTQKKSATLVCGFLFSDQKLLAVLIVSCLKVGSNGSCWVAFNMMSF